MKKLIILIIVALAVGSCATRAHCDAYGQVETVETDSTKSV